VGDEGGLAAGVVLSLGMQASGIIFAGVGAVDGVRVVRFSMFFICSQSRCLWSIERSISPFAMVISFIALRYAWLASL